MALFEFSIAVELFGLERPEMGSDWYQFTVASLDGGPARTTAGIRVEVDSGLEAMEGAGTVVIPGWVTKEPVPPTLIDALRQAYDRGARIVTICSGVFVLAAAGLLKGRRATTHWKYTDYVRETYPDIEFVPDVLYVDEGQILTSAGSAAGIDLCLHLVRQDYGTELATQLARQLVVPPQRDGGQAQYIDMPMPEPEGDSLFAGTLAWLQEHLAEPVTVEDLAARSAMSPRTFARRFQAALGLPPYQWLVSQRIRLAQRLLETTSLTVDSVAAHSGFSTAANLRKHFSQAVHTSPQAYRRTFARRHVA
jgi:AraC family transcriptional activator FtrA